MRLRYFPYYLPSAPATPPVGVGRWRNRLPLFSSALSRPSELTASRIEFYPPPTPPASEGFTRWRVRPYYYPNTLDRPSEPKMAAVILTPPLLPLSAQYPIRRQPRPPLYPSELSRPTHFERQLGHYVKEDLPPGTVDSRRMDVGVKTRIYYHRPRHPHIPIPEFYPPGVPFTPVSAMARTQVLRPEKYLDRPAVWVLSYPLYFTPPTPHSPPWTAGPLPGALILERPTRDLRPYPLFFPSPVPFVPPKTDMRPHYMTLPSSRGWEEFRLPDYMPPPPPPVPPVAGVRSIKIEGMLEGIAEQRKVES